MYAPTSPGLIPGSRNHTRGASETASLGMRRKACKVNKKKGHVLKLNRYSLPSLHETRERTNVTFAEHLKSECVIVRMTDKSTSILTGTEEALCNYLPQTRVYMPMVERPSVSGSLEQLINLGRGKDVGQGKD
eukprot:6202757-Pleurochrysis_carterae.AAC.2